LYTHTKLQVPSYYVSTLVLLVDNVVCLPQSSSFAQRSYGLTKETACVYPDIIKVYVTDDVTKQQL